MPAPFALTQNIRCPILGISGNNDRNPSPADIAQLAAELATAPDVLVPMVSRWQNI